MKILSTIRSRVAALALIGAMLGVGAVTAHVVAAPAVNEAARYLEIPLEVSEQGAEAFSQIEYIANCPGTAVSQQLKITNYSYSYQTVTAQGVWDDHPKTLYNQNPTFSPTQSNTAYGSLTYWTLVPGDAILYRMNGPGNLNWYYSVGCYY